MKIFIGVVDVTKGSFGMYMDDLKEEYGFKPRKVYEVRVISDRDYFILDYLAIFPKKVSEDDISDFAQRVCDDSFTEGYGEILSIDVEEEDGPPLGKPKFVKPIGNFDSLEEATDFDVLLKAIWSRHRRPLFPEIKDGRFLCYLAE